MNITPEIECQFNIKVDKVQLVFNGNEIVNLNNVTEWEVIYEKTGTSTVTVLFCGVNQKLLDMQRFKARLNYMKIIGQGISIDDNKDQNMILNIPCDMCINTLNLNFYDSTSTEVTFSGDMW